MILLDASALLAYMFKETGHEVVAGYLNDCCISSVNLLEVASRFSRDQLPAEPVLHLIAELGITVIPYENKHIAPTAALATYGKQYGLSLADRVCLATAQIMDIPVLTADEIWKDVGLEIEIIVFR